MNLPLNDPPKLTKTKNSVVGRLSAGLIAGAADDDTSGIATYSQVGAAYGYATLWTLALALPLMIGIQMISARIGRVTGVGIGSNIRKHYAHPIAYCVAFALLLASVINLAADIGAMGSALKLLIGGPALLYTAAFALLSLALQVFVLAPNEN